jgi:hypothetical protein
MLKHEIYSTNKKLLLSLGVVAGAVLLIAGGIGIHNALTNGAEENARLYQTAIQTQNDNEFNYSIDTKQGNVLAEVTVSPVDLVKFDEMNKEFVKVKKIKERYTRHERTVCETKYRSETRTRSVYDSATQSYSTETYTEQVPYTECHQETYYSWDQIDKWEKSAKEVDMAGRKYSIGLFSLGTQGIDAKDIIPGETGKYVREDVDSWLDIGWGDSEGDIRYGYSVLSLPKSGTVFLNVTEGVKPVFGRLIDLQGKKPATLVTEAQKAAETQGTVFTWFWGFLVILWLGGLGFYVWFGDY